MHHRVLEFVDPVPFSRTNLIILYVALVLSQNRRKCTCIHVVSFFVYY